MHGMRMTMKRVFFLILFLCIVLCSCGKDPMESCEPDDPLLENNDEIGTDSEDNAINEGASEGGSDFSETSDECVDSTDDLGDSANTSNYNPSNKPSIELPDDEF